MSLADEFLADLEELDESEITNAGDVKDEVKLESIADKVEANNKSVKFITKLLGSRDLNDLVDDIQNSTISRSTINVAQLSKEYDIIVRANAMMIEVENEINIIHKYLRDIYNKRFPELESLVTDAYDYIQTVHYLGNIPEGIRIEDVEFLSPAIKMVVTLTMTTTIGLNLSDEEMELLNEACEIAGKLSQYRVILFEYIQSRMTFIAPNVTKMTGAALAAQLIGGAGGLTALSKIPSCNILLIGSKKVNLTGFSNINALPHTGLIYYSEFVQKIPPVLRRKMATVYANKITLAARMDDQRSHRDGTYGEKLMEIIQTRFDKLTEPAQVKVVKALPRPDDFQKKRRGGKRHRSDKQKIALTELRRSANTIKFGQIQEDIHQNSLGIGFGTIGQSGTGIVRNAQLDTKTKVAISKRLQKNMQSMNAVYGTKSSVKSTVSGTSSSVVFTPLKGLEIINPNAADATVIDDTAISAKYFSSATGFSSAIKKE